MADAATVRFEAYLGDESMVADVENWLNAREDALDVERRDDDSGILPLIGAVIAGAIAAAAIVKLVDHIRDSFQCQQLLDARGPELKITTDCEHRNGKIVIVAAKDQVVNVTDVPDVLDLTGIAKSAITEGANVAKAAIEAAGGKAEVEDEAATA